MIDANYNKLMLAIGFIGGALATAGIVTDWLGYMSWAGSLKSVAIFFLIVPLGRFATLVEADEKRKKEIPDKFLPPEKAYN